ncbi:hypothetical protein M409DRAFT_16167 [Zasmidium cellare ATCC 36951]|uniref:Uncharacterized protein n=1 Tax=Zasmidium cellare ATCC 36951 TaxID=1080233 RepID=A0A6A6D650_ZASCE|nr:uncharacterized protein M409DRAFT_16167 [Zasmidium cellare ATCC 36951]KAF2173898.1 hypothetical protein M409DRAFT_16167 [Zasmidium cellare ATCC 36951]
MAANDDIKQATTSPTTSPPTKPPPTLFSLHAELRNEIHRLALIETNSFCVRNKRYRVPDLLQVCQQCRNEASSIYYGENEFEACGCCSEMDQVRLTKRRVERFGGKMTLR